MYQSELFYPLLSLSQIATLQQIASLQASHVPTLGLAPANYNQIAVSGSADSLNSQDLNQRFLSSGSLLNNCGNLDICQSIRSDILQQINPDLISHAIGEVPRFIMDGSYGLPLQDKVQLYARAGKRSSNYEQEHDGQPKRQRLQTEMPSSNRWTSQMAIPPLSITGNEQITKVMWQYFLKHQQSEAVYSRKVQLRDALYTVVQDIFPYAGLYIVGSSMSGFGTSRSDLDLCLMISHQQIDQKKEATEILLMVQKAFHKCSFINKAHVIKAKVPILKFWDEISNAECDLNINNSVGIRNTHLLKCYCSLDWRVRPLTLFIKHWARFHDINDARKMTISSYSLSMMVIHYLQYGCDPPMLPSLQKLYPNMFSTQVNVRQMRFDLQLTHKNENTQSLGDLFLGFLDYYTFKFNYNHDVISVRLGTKVPLFMIMEQTDQQSMWKCLCIEEPFDLSNTARSVYDQNTFIRVKRVFYSSYTKLCRTRNVEDILKYPF